MQCKRLYSLEYTRQYGMVGRIYVSTLKYLITLILFFKIIFSAKFGLYRVNFTDPRRTRTPKASALFYKKVIQTKMIPPMNDDPSVLQI